MAILHYARGSIRLETAGRSLEDIDVIFALAHSEGVSPVWVSLRKDIPLTESEEADRILGVEPDSRSSVDDSGSETHVEKNEKSENRV